MGIEMEQVALQMKVGFARLQHRKKESDKPAANRVVLDVPSAGQHNRPASGKRKQTARANHSLTNGKRIKQSFHQSHLISSTTFHLNPYISCRIFVRSAKPLAEPHHQKLR